MLLIRLIYQKFKILLKKMKNNDKIKEKRGLRRILCKFLREMRLLDSQAVLPLL